MTDGSDTSPKREPMTKAEADAIIDNAIRKVMERDGIIYPDAFVKLLPVFRQSCTVQNARNSFRNSRNSRNSNRSNIYAQ